MSPLWQGLFKQSGLLSETIVGESIVKSPHMSAHYACVADETFKGWALLAAESALGRKTDNEQSKELRKC